LPLQSLGAQTKNRVTGRIVIAALILVLLVLAPSSVLAAGEDPACEVRYPSDARVAWDCRVLGRGETVERLFGNRWADVLRFNRIDRPGSRSSCWSI
jgi:hypothetical protein